jgi:hypothetical protein
MKIDITIDDREYHATFTADCAGLWGTYRGSRMNVTRMLERPRGELERRYAEVHGIDGVTHGRMPAPTDNDPDFPNPWAAQLLRDLDTYRWVCEECPRIALAIMVAEWEGDDDNK